MAIEYLDSLGITNEMMKEHLMDLCTNNNIKGLFDKLSTQQKSAFTKAWNSGHKDPTQGVRAKKTKKAASGGNSDDEDSEDDNDDMMNEDEKAEIKKGKAIEKL